jgi:septum site-determining protein MinD
VIITFHSYKGGTGKTLLSTNLATLYAQRGERVCLFDLDLRAPSLSSIFKNEKEYWINDYLNRICEIDDVLTSFSYKNIKKGKLSIGFANPSTVAIREMAAKDRRWEMQALGRLFSLKSSLLNEGRFDVVIFDTSPGLQYSSINAIVSTDLVFVVTSMDISDLMGTKRMVGDFYDLFDKKTGVIINKVPIEYLSNMKKCLGDLEALQLPIVEVVPCSCDVLKAERGCLFASEKPNHPFTKKLQKIATNIKHFF